MLRALSLQLELPCPRVACLHADRRGAGARTDTCSIWKCMPFHWPPMGRVHGSYIIYKDISEQIRASQAERKHAEVLSQLVAELQLRTQADEPVERNGRLARVLRDNPGSLLRSWPSRCRNFCPRPFPAPSIFSGHRGTWWRRRCGGADQRFPRRSLLPMRAGVCAGVSRIGTSWRGGINCSHLTEPATIKCLCVPMVGHGRHVGSAVSRVCQRTRRCTDEPRC